MALGIYSGKDAYVDGIGCVQSWQATPGVSAQRYTSSCTDGGSGVAPGIQNWTGQISGLGFWPEAVLPTGASFAFQGVINNTAGQGDLKSLDGTAYVEQLTIDINKESGAPVSWQATLGFDGTPTESTTGAADSSEGVVPVYGDSLDVKLHATTPVTIASTSCAIRTAQIVFRRQMSTYVKNGSTFRKPGHLECDVSFGVFCPVLYNSQYPINALLMCQIALGAEFWEFNHLRILGRSGLQVDRGSNNIIGYTVNAQFDGTYNAIQEDPYIAFNTENGDTWHDFYGTKPETQQ